jgi:hypothetical protein
MTRIAILALLLLLPAGASAGKGQGAFWRSLLVPGWGQRYATGGGGRFFAAELAFWGGYLGFERLREVRRDQYRAFAAAHADARPQGKDGEYFDDLGFYQSFLLGVGSPSVARALPAIAQCDGRRWPSGPFYDRPGRGQPSLCSHPRGAHGQR